MARFMEAERKERAALVEDMIQVITELESWGIVVRHPPIDQIRNWGVGGAEMDLMRRKLAEYRAMLQK